MECENKCEVLKEVITLLQFDKMIIFLEKRSAANDLKMSNKRTECE